MKKPSAISNSAKAAFLLAALFGFISSFPIWFGLARTPAGSIFLWSPVPYDNNTYFAKMRPGYRGEWLSLNPYDCTTRKPALLFPFHIALGRIASVYRDFLKWRTGAEPPVYQTLPIVYNMTRFASAFLLALTIYWLARMVTPRPSQRLWITALALFAGGWGHACNTEANILKSCILFPHFSVSLVFYVLACGVFLRAVKRPRSWKSCCLGAAVAGFALGWMHPYDLPPLGAIAAVALVWRWLQTRRLPWALFAVAAVFTLSGAAPVIYQLALKAAEPMYGVIDAQNYLRWKYWWEWAAMLDIYLAAAALGVAALWPRRRRPEAMFVIVWVIAGVVMINAPEPVTFSRRMIEGLPIGLAFAVAAGVERWIIRPLTRRNAKPLPAADSQLAVSADSLLAATVVSPSSLVRRRRLRLLGHCVFAAVLLALLPRTLWVLYDMTFAAYDPRSTTQYIRFEEAEAMEWLARHSGGRDVVWAGPERGNVIPFLSGNRVFYGHNVETSYSQERLLDTRALFTGRMPLATFRNFIQNAGIKYLYFGPLERAMLGGDIAAFDPETLATPVFQNIRVKIYRLR